MNPFVSLVQNGLIGSSLPKHPEAVAIEGFGFGPLSISVMGFLVEEVALPGAGVWYVPSDIIIGIDYKGELVRQTYKVWPMMERVLAEFAGSETIRKSVKVKLVEDKRILTKVRAKKYE